jgi:hypothetical protein
MVLQYTMPRLPSDARVGVGSEAFCGAFGVPSTCGFLDVGFSAAYYGGYSPATGKDFAETNSVTISDAGYPLGNGFEAFQPGPGSIDFAVDIDWALSSTGFAGVGVEKDDQIRVPITWARS